MELAARAGGHEHVSVEAFAQIGAGEHALTLERTRETVEVGGEAGEGEDMELVLGSEASGVLRDVRALDRSASNDVGRVRARIVGDRTIVVG